MSVNGDKFTEGADMEKIQLQGTGWHPAKKVKEICIGDIVEWNYGFKSTVINIQPTKTGKQIYLTLLEHSNGKINQRRLGAERLIAIAEGRDDFGIYRTY